MRKGRGQFPSHIIKGKGFFLHNEMIFLHKYSKFRFWRESKRFDQDELRNQGEQKRLHDKISSYKGLCTISSRPCLKLGHLPV